ncbi:MAG: rhomboid family intramembrane serine protease [Candidatus Dojkabacteria bacterium]|nr:rhomboid family intramembrane serine protease [Candidatus Dojkabacteria bacterium]
MNFEIRLELSFLNFLLGINLLVFLLILLGFGDSLSFLVLGTYNVFEVGAFFQLLTFNFVHINLFHFVFNFLALYNIGNMVNTFYGGKVLFTVYVLGGISAGIFTLLGSLFEYVNIFTVGASGSIFALLGLILGGILKKNRFGTDLPINAVNFISYIFIAILFGFIPGLNVNNWAHIGGLIAGVLMGLFLNNSISVSTYFGRLKTNFFFILSCIIVLLSISQLILFVLL